MRGYDPYQYQPMMRYFYDGAPLPQDIADASKANPAAARHIQAAQSFKRWLNAEMPQVAEAVLSRNPRALDPVAAVTGGSMSPKALPAKGLSGLGDLVESAPATDWGKTIADAAKGILAYKTQQDILDMNIRRAEQGLAPIDSASLAPTVNVGVPPEMMTMAKFAIGGALALGLVAVLSSRRR